jgi:hypothetical protein
MVFFQLYHVWLFGRNVVYNDLEEYACKHQKCEERDSDSIDSCVQGVFEDLELPHTLRGRSNFSSVYFVKPKLSLNISIIELIAEANLIGGTHLVDISILHEV